MAFTATQLGIEARTAYSNDKPVMLGENVLESISAGARGWRSWNPATFPGDNEYGDYTVGGVNYDATDSAYPTNLISDRFTHSRSRALKPAGIPTAYNDRWSIAFFYASGMSFDSVGLLGHNLGTLSRTYGTANGGNPFVVRVGVSNDGSAWTTVATFTDPQTDKPLVSFDLANGGGVPASFAQFSGVVYFAISIVCPGATMGQSPSQLPEIGEIVLGRRLQLLHQARVPYAEKIVGADTEKMRGDTGAYSSYTRSTGRRAISGTYEVAEEAALLDFYKTHISHGMFPFLFVPRGSKAEFPTIYGGAEPGESFWVALQDNDFSIEVGDGLHDKSVSLRMLESADYNSGVA